MKVILLSSDDLCPGDLILSYKKPSKWNIFQRFFDWILKLKGKKKYGEDCIFSECNHVRLYIGESTFLDKLLEVKVPTVYEWTFPEAKKSPLENWMLSPAYARIYRYTGKLDPAIEEQIDTIFFTTLAIHQTRMIKMGRKGWKKYDWGQLIDMAIGWGRVFDLGRGRRVCSTGGRWLLETAFKIKTMLTTPLNRTLPCAGANEPEFGYIGTEGDRVMGILPEPKGRN